MKNKIKEAQILNLNEDMVASLINKVEEEIFQLSVQLESKEKELKEAEEIYLPIKGVCDLITHKIEKERNTLNALIGYRDNKNERKEIRVLKSISNSMNGKHRKARRPWTQEGIKVLEKEQRFLTGNTLVFKILENNPEWKTFTNKTERSFKSHIVTNFTMSALKKNGTADPKIILKDEKFGLKEWVGHAKYILK